MRNKFLLIIAGLSTGVMLGFTGYTHIPQTYNYYLDYDITTPAASRDLVQLLNNADSGDTVVIHCAGFGGEGETMDTIITAMNNSKAKVVAEVDAPCYSAHAYIAASAPNLVMEPYTFLMFHTFSGYGYDCKMLEGQTDRGHSAVVKCEQQIEALTIQSNKIIDNIKILTPYEKNIIEHGYDVYLTAEEVSNRQVDMRLAKVAPLVPDSIKDRITLIIPKK